MKEKLKEFKTIVKYDCGCKLLTPTIGYKPKTKEDKPCPHCFMVNLMGADYASNNNIQQN